MAFRGNEPISSKIRISNWILEQVNTLNYLGCNLSYGGEKDLDVKIIHFLR
jgi:hypothetical protein